MNILIYNFKGGCSKSTTSSIVASYLSDATLIEVDHINQSDKRLDTDGYYKSIQMNWRDESSKSFLEFESLILKQNTKVIDIGAVMLDSFHIAMKKSNLYDVIDLVIVPAHDGEDDFRVAMKFLANIKDEIPASKIMFGLNRFSKEYDSPQEQFDSFFDNQDLLKKEFKIDLSDENNWFAIKDSKSIKKARKRGIVFKSLVDVDIQELTKRQRAAIDDDELRDELTAEKFLIGNAQEVYADYIEPMLIKIVKKMEK
jgi:hypothetical protein